MVSLKRKRSLAPDEKDNLFDAGFSSGFSDRSDDEVDISSALVGNRTKKNRTSRGLSKGSGPSHAFDFDASELQSESRDDGADVIEDGDEDEELQDMIKEAITKRNVKGGTEVLKKTKGKKGLVKGEVGGGSFQSMGLYPWLLRSLTLQGFRTPTPIQRLALPPLLSTPPRDLVGMARTGSGKTLAYLLPLIQRLGGSHSTTFGARALILVPARELAVQVMRVGKELVRGRGKAEGGGHVGDKEEEEGEDGGARRKGGTLRWGLIVGGEGMDEQFEMITSNPDVIIATPGRLLHLIVEMSLDLKSIQYVVFDEADRLFEMGFETALNEILHRLPATRQTLLFSATLPKSLVEFAKAGLQNPKLVRLDAESKISSDLQMAFFSVKQAEKDACLLHLLRNVIGVPFGSTKKKEDEDGNKGDKGKRKAKHDPHQTAPHQTLIFAATKHHVEYLVSLLTTAGYACSHVYGTLDQSARSQQMNQFRYGETSILVVTDVAARGIDIPVLENVVNYDFPAGARVFVHRVGRTARAGRKGWAWSFVANTELPYLLDLQLFLGRPMKATVPPGAGEEAYAESLVLGPFERERVDEEVEYIRTLYEENHNLESLRGVATKAQEMYERSRGKASQASYKRAKEMTKDAGRWGVVGAESTGVHPVLLGKRAEGAGMGGEEGGESRWEEEQRRRKLLQKVNTFRPAETVFEIGSRGKTENAQLMKERRKTLEKARERAGMGAASSASAAKDEEPVREENATGDVEMADEEDIAAVFDVSDKKKSKKGGKDSFRDEEFYMSHYQKDANTEKGYSLRDGASFAEQAQTATFDLTNDEGIAAQKRRQLTWDKKKKKFVKGAGEGADNVKLVKTENGTRLPATYRSGRFDEWKAKNRVGLPRIGEAEPENARRATQGGGPGKKWKHNKVATPKPLDKLSKDYEKKLKQMKKSNASDEGASEAGPSGGEKGAKGSKRYGGKSIGRVKSELKSAEQIRKTRMEHERRKARNARQPRRKGRR